MGAKCGPQEGTENTDSDTLRVQNTTEGMRKGIKELG